MTSTRRGFLAATLGAAVAAGLPTAPAYATPRPPRRVVAAPQSWMSNLPDDRSLLRLTIPGTHDSCSDSPLNGTPWAQTQNWSLADQFAHGIRFLDIRCNGLQDHMSDSFGIYHGPAYQGITFDGVLNECRTFLTRNPGEVLIMRVKKENGTDNDVGADFERIFKGYLDIKGYRSLFWIGDHVPALGAARGRIVLITEFDNTLPALRWPGGDNGNLSNSTFYVQDRYQNRGLAGLESGSAGTGSTRTGSSGGDKFDYIAACFDKAATDPANTQLYINFTSYADRAWPVDNAAAIMPKVERYLTEKQGVPAHLGVVPMDFPDLHPKVLDLLLERNTH
ncbi:phosphatidylinositol-specific phospholipase C [Nocardia huaxiensis]|uniref:1-phosphatidylinositol phosphodiesterase n=1 Tax=Nocardia huaxiensis TaxID=2755382 RepID=A0A7D6VKU3_9NOCA|nr:phosphatidylinositol-specific phospholipase C [Nocardia huaxiensis]QLY31830.1 phosphatidylinositol-specific phospholipase C [Nocardia huaxiensis]